MVAALVFISCNRPVSPLWMLQRVCVGIKQSGRHCLWRLKEICTLLSEQQTSCLTSRDIFLCGVFYRGASTLSLTLRPPKTRRERLELKQLHSADKESTWEERSDVFSSRSTFLIFQLFFQIASNDDVGKQLCPSVMCCRLLQDSWGAANQPYLNSDNWSGVSFEL